MKMLRIKLALQNYFLKQVIADMESRHFRTDEDTGAHPRNMQMHNYYRWRAGLPFLKLSDLPKWCKDHKKYDLCHNKEK